MDEATSEPWYLEPVMNLLEVVIFENQSAIKFYYASVSDSSPF